MQTYQLHVSQGRDSVREIRSELFVFPEILDVFVTGRPDAVVVVCSGRPRPGEWLRTLRAVGYEVPARRHASPPRGPNVVSLATPDARMSPHDDKLPVAA